MSVNDLLLIIFGAVLIVAGAVMWKTSSRFASTFRSLSPMGQNSKVSKRTYTSKNVRWAAGGAVVIGIIMIVAGIVQFATHGI